MFDTRYTVAGTENSWVCEMPPQTKALSPKLLLPASIRRQKRTLKHSDQSKNTRGGSAVASVPRVMCIIIGFNAIIPTVAPKTVAVRSR
mmetsp:Transcript_20406/g.38645  ORF Transcript_20406/g.38645 Transcript_20406/m.38645 type:complete len:89 (+) Transcript_20406:247-513(+)